MSLSRAKVKQNVPNRSPKRSCPNVSVQNCAVSIMIKFSEVIRILLDRRKGNNVNYEPVKNKDFVSLSHYKFQKNVPDRSSKRSFPNFFMRNCGAILIFRLSDMNEI